MDGCSSPYSLSEACPSTAPAPVILIVVGGRLTRLSNGGLSMDRRVKPAEDEHCGNTSGATRPTKALTQRPPADVAAAEAVGEVDRIHSRIGPVAGFAEGGGAGAGVEHPAAGGAHTPASSRRVPAGPKNAEARSNATSCVLCLH